MPNWIMQKPQKLPCPFKCLQIRALEEPIFCTNGVVFVPTGCSQLTSSGLSNLLQLRQLEELELTNCPGSSPELVSYLRQGIEPDLKGGGQLLMLPFLKKNNKKCY
jgi:hypothetical protein